MASASVYFNESPIGHCLASVGKGAPNHDGVMVGRTETGNSDGRVWGWARVCACIRPCMRACVRDVFAIYDDNILSRLIMIIIKIIILYFIKIRHTDDFPSVGIPASNNINNMDFYILEEHTPAMQIKALYNTNMHKK